MLLSTKPADAVFAGVWPSRSIENALVKSILTFFPSPQSDSELICTAPNPGASTGRLFERATPTDGITRSSSLSTRSSPELPGGRLEFRALQKLIVWSPAKLLKFTALRTSHGCGLRTIRSAGSQPNGSNADFSVDVDRWA